MLGRCWAYGAIEHSFLTSILVSLDIFEEDQSAVYAPRDRLFAASHRACFQADARH